MIRGNHENCSQFAAVARLDWLVDRLDSQQSSKGALSLELEAWYYTLTMHLLLWVYILSPHYPH